METLPLANATVRVVDVAIDPKSGGTDAIWTYGIEGPAEVGDAFFVPLGPRAVIGYVIRVYDATEADLGFPLKSLRLAGDRIVGLTLPKQVLQTIRYVSTEYLCPLTASLSVAIPPGVRERLVSAWKLTGAISDAPLTILQQEVLRTLEDAGGTVFEKGKKKLPASSQKALKLLRAKGLVESIVQLDPGTEKREATNLLRLPSNPEKIEAFLHKEGKRKPAQAITLMRLQSASPTPMSPMEIKALSGVTDATLKAMLETGLLEKVEQDTLVPKTPPAPNLFQQQAVDAIVEAVNGHRSDKFLLYGVTGSGKTEVYLRCAAEALKAGRQVLYLVPEIALAAQAISQLRERFGQNVSILHSELTPKERFGNWVRIREGSAPVVLGARSAVFAPLRNIGLIVMDEEHESSYKQESMPRYHAKRVAEFLAEQHGCPIVLGSATPSIESYQQAEEGKLHLLELPERAASARLPSVKILDLREDYKSGRPSILSEQLCVQIARTLERGEQTILFLNRRAYSPFLICRDCGMQFRCPRCAVSLAYSRRDLRLRCHHCGFQQLPPDICPSCGGHKLSPFGIGTEKVEEAVESLFPEASVVRLDRDVARKKGALEEILAGFRSGDYNILVGTQMVAKGLDFPNVTLVGVIAADISLNIPDFRSSERTFQLLSQVAGRAGRGTAPGHVVIQTLNPDHVAVTCAQSHDFLTFFKAIREEREEALYPPFVRLVNIVVSGEDLAGVRELSDSIARELEAVPDALILGPSDCAIERIQGRFRKHVLVKLPPDASVADVGKALTIPKSKDLQVVLDVDPYSLV